MDESFENWGNLFVSIPDIIKNCNSTNDFVTNGNLNSNENCPVTKKQTDYQNDKTPVDIENSIANFLSLEVNNKGQNIDENKEFQLSEDKINQTEERSLDSQNPSIHTNLLITENVCIPSLFQNNSENNSACIKDVGNAISNNSLVSPNSEPKGLSVNNVTTSNNDDNDLNTTSSTLSLVANDNEYSSSQSDDKENLMHVENNDNETNDYEAVESLYSEQKCILTKDHEASGNNNELKSISSTQPLSPNDNEDKLIDENILKNADLPLIASANEMVEKKEENSESSDNETIDLTLDPSPKKTSSLGDRCLRSFTLRNKKNHNVNKNRTKKQKHRQLKVEFSLPSKGIKETSEKSCSAKLSVKHSIKKSVNKKLVKNEVTNRKPRLSSCSQASYYQRIVIEETKVIAKVNQKLTDIQASFIKGLVNFLNSKFVLDKLYAVLKKIEVNQVQQLINEPMLSSKAYFLKKSSFLRSTMTFHQSLSFKVSKHHIQKRGPQQKSSRNEEIISKSEMCHQNGLSTLQSHKKYLQQDVPSKHTKGLSSCCTSDAIVARPNIQPPISKNHLPNSEQRFANASYLNQIQNSFENALPLSSSQWNPGIPLDNNTKDDFLKHLQLHRFQNVDTSSNIRYDNRYSDNNYPILHGNHAEPNIAYTQRFLPVQNPSKTSINGAQDHTVNNTGSRTFSSGAFPQMPEINQAQYSFCQTPTAYNTMSSMDRNYAALLSYQNNTAMNLSQFDTREANIVENNAHGAATPSNSTTFLNRHLPLQLQKYEMPTIVHSMQQFNIPERTLSSNDKVLNWICTQNRPTSKKFQNATSSTSCANSKTIIAGTKHNVNTWIAPEIPPREKNYPETRTSCYASKEIKDLMPYSSSIAMNVGNGNNERMFTSEVQTVAEDLTVKKKHSHNGVTSSRSTLSGKLAMHNIPLEENIPSLDLINKTTDSIKAVEARSKFQTPFANVSKCARVHLKAKALAKDTIIVFPAVGSAGKTITSQMLASTKSGKRKPRNTSTKKKSASQNSQTSVEDLHQPDTQVHFSTQLDQENNQKLKSKVSTEKQNTSVEASMVHVHASNINIHSVVSSSSFSPNFNKQPPAVCVLDTVSPVLLPPVHLPPDTFLTIIPLLQNKEQQHSSNVLKDISNNSVPEPVLNEFELPSVIELIKAGIIPFGDNILSIETPDGPKYATLDYSGFIVNTDGLIFNSVMEWCQFIPSLSSLGPPLPIKACYEKVFYNGQSLMSICLSYPTQQKTTKNSVTDRNDSVNQIVPFSYFYDNKYPDLQNLSKLKIFPIGDNEIGPLSPNSQWGNIDKWE